MGLAGVTMMCAESLMSSTFQCKKGRSPECMTRLHKAATSQRFQMVHVTWFRMVHILTNGM